jgi:leucyl aminopeptidase
VPVTLTASALRPDVVRADLLVVPAGPDGPLGTAARALRPIGPTLRAVVTATGFEGKPGQTALVPAGDALGVPAVLLVGVGDAAAVTVDGIRRAGATVARAAGKVRSVATTLLDAAPRGTAEAAAQALAEGVLLGGYQFLEFKSHATPTALRRVSVLDGRAEVRRGLARGSAVGAAAVWARDRVNEPPDTQSPAQFVAAARRRLAGTGVRVEVLTERQILAQRLGGVAGVGQGSARPPRFLKCTYEPTRRAPGHLALVGKGVVFDSGGLSLKTAAGMETMKTDMSGAAAVVAAMSVLGRVGVRHRVTGYVPLVENMPSGTAIRPGDVLRIRNGTTVEVLNTDAEGRLILADALSLAVEDRVDAIIDLATLTGACVVALGDKIAGLMGNHDGWRDQVQGAADRAGEPVWPLPLPTDYRRLLDSEVADLKNVSAGGYGGALTAGIFLQQFVGDRPWVHLDIAGPSRASGDDGYLVKGGTGFGVRTLVELVSGFTVPEGTVTGANGASRKPRATRTVSPRTGAAAKATKKVAARKSTAPKPRTPR